MRFFNIPLSRNLCALAAIAALSGCGGLPRIDNPINKLGTIITPYQIEVVQGNFVAKEQLAQISKGMSREQVQNILGTPLVASIFHAHRWDYVFTIERKGVKDQQRKVSFWFKEDVVDKIEAGELIGENEFVAQVSPKRDVKPVNLTADEATLRAFAQSNPLPKENATPPAASARTYPALEEPGARTSAWDRASLESVASFDRAAAAPAPVPAPRPAAASPLVASGTDANGVLTAWQAAWRAGDANAIIATYAPDFKGRAATRAEWESGMRAKVGTAGAASLALNDITLSNTSGNESQLAFRQRLTGASAAQNGFTTLTLAPRDGRWVIVAESFLPD
jgi:outer membrane protein assembly factor BamE